MPRSSINRRNHGGRGNFDSYVDRSTAGLEVDQGERDTPLRKGTGLITDESYVTRDDGYAYESDGGDIFLDEGDDEIEWEAPGETR